MFMREIDWNDPKFSRWHLSELHPLSDAQIAAAWEDDEIDDPPITEIEQKELCKQYDCKVELFHSNVCHGVERDWPLKHFGVADFRSLESRKQRQIHRTMEKNGVQLYNRYVDAGRRQERIKCQNANVFAPFWEERRCRLRFERVKKIGENEKSQRVHGSIEQRQFEASANIPETSDGSINDEEPRSDFQNTKIGPRSTKSKRSVDTSQQDSLSPDATNLRRARTKTPKNATSKDSDTNFVNSTPTRRITRSQQKSTSNQAKVPTTSENTTPNRRFTRSTPSHDTPKRMEKEKESEFYTKTPGRRSTKQTLKRPDASSPNSLYPTPMRPQNNADISANENITSPSAVAHRESGFTPPSRRSDRIGNKPSDTETMLSKLPKKMSKRPNATPNSHRTFGRFASNLSMQTVVNSKPIHDDSISNLISSVGVDSFSQELGTPTIDQQSPDIVVTNSTPDFIPSSPDETASFDASPENRQNAKKTQKSNNNATEVTYSEDFDQLNDSLTSTQKKY